AAEAAAAMLQRTDIDRHWLAPGLAIVGRAQHEGAEPALGLERPGPVAPLLGHWMRAPGRLLRLDATLEEAGDGEVDQQRAVGELRQAAIPVAHGRRPGQHDLQRLLVPGLAAVARADQQRLARIVVIGITLLVEHRHQVAVLQALDHRLVHAVAGMLVDDVMGDVLDDAHLFLSPLAGEPTARDTAGVPAIIARGPRSILTWSDENLTGQA